MKLKQIMEEEWFKDISKIMVDNPNCNYRQARKDRLMSIATFKIELRIDVADDEKKLVIRESVINVARELLAITSLLSEGPKPKIEVSEQAFFGSENTVNISEEK